MSYSHRSVTAALVAALFTVFSLVPMAAGEEKAPDYTFATPVFGLATGGPRGSLLVADAGAGIVALQGRRGQLIVSLPGVTDMARTKGGLFAITGGGDDESSAKLFGFFKGKLQEIADLGAFEAEVNPDSPEVNPNPFDVAALPNGSALVADAGGNSLVIVDRQGNIDWVATLPVEDVSTDNVKHLFNCPMGPPSICNLPAVFANAQPVATSVAVGPDGYYYMGELKGFPAPTGESRVWRINPNARHARCGSSPDCSVIADGFTSIVDLAFGPDGTLHVVELDEASWFAVEVVGIPLGGTVNACTHVSEGWTCTPEATGLRMPIAAAVDAGGTVHVAVSALVPGEAEVIELGVEP